jgi:hypothetical protein
MAQHAKLEHIVLESHMEAQCRSPQIFPLGM